MRQGSGEGKKVGELAEEIFRGWSKNTEHWAGSIDKEEIFMTGNL